MRDILNAAIVLAVVAALLLFARNVFAGGRWFDEAAIYVDVTRDVADVYCRDPDGHASHLGARVDLYTHGPHTVRTLWVHNSCVEEQDDKKSRDVFGVGYEYQLW